MSEDAPLLIGGGTTAALTPAVAGSKAAQLAQMARLGLDVPPAFVLPIALCAAVNAGASEAKAAMRRGLDRGIAWLEQATGRRFGDARAPLLVSVRSGAAASMPGMLETVLDIGLNDDAVHGLIRQSGNPRLAFDCWRRLVQGYGEVVDGVPAAAFDRALADMVRREGVAGERDLDSEALERLVAEFRELAQQQAGRSVPDDPRDQLREAAAAVYRSWQSPRAREYRRLNRLDHLAGTAVTVQAMVFGNAGPSSGAGVAFSRDPGTGEDALYVEYLSDAQGEDVVSGRRTPAGAARLAARLPQVAERLAQGVRRLEAEARDAQDVEFTVEEGRLWFLQTRTAKRTPRAALRIAVDMVRGGLIAPAEALARLAAIDLAAVAVTSFADEAAPVATAIAAAPGVASGRVALSAARAKALAASDPVILLRPETSTDDVEGFAAAAGIVTTVGGRTAHAAVVARQLGKVCLVGCRALAIDEERGEALIGGVRLHEGDWLSLDGDSGAVTLGRRPIVRRPPPELAEVERWRGAGGA